MFQISYLHLACLCVSRGTVASPIELRTTPDRVIIESVMLCGGPLFRPACCASGHLRREENRLSARWQHAADRKYPRERYCCTLQMWAVEWRWDHSNQESPAMNNPSQALTRLDDAGSWKLEARVSCLTGRLSICLDWLLYWLFAGAGVCMVHSAYQVGKSSLSTGLTDDCTQMYCKAPCIPCCQI